LGFLLKKLENNVCSTRATAVPAGHRPEMRLWRRRKAAPGRALDKWGGIPDSKVFFRSFKYLLRFLNERGLDLEALI
jgi:hypothetical protein